MFGHKTAEKLDAVAEKLYRAGKKVAGEKGGRAGDAVATAVLSGFRFRCDSDCVRKGCDHDDNR